MHLPVVTFGLVFKHYVVGSRMINFTAAHNFIASFWYKNLRSSSRSGETSQRQIIIFVKFQMFLKSSFDPSVTFSVRFSGPCGNYHHYESTIAAPGLRGGLTKFWRLTVKFSTRTSLSACTAQDSPLASPSSRWFARSLEVGAPRPRLFPIYFKPNLDSLRARLAPMLIFSGVLYRTCLLSASPNQ